MFVGGAVLSVGMGSLGVSSAKKLKGIPGEGADCLEMSEVCTDFHLQA